MCLLLAVRAGAGRGAGLWNLAESIWGQGEGLGASSGARVFGAQWAWGQRAKCLERGIYRSRPSGLGEGWAEGSTWSRCREPGKAVPPTACRADTAAVPNHRWLSCLVEAEAASESPSSLRSGGPGPGKEKPPKGKKGRGTRAPANSWCTPAVWSLRLQGQAWVTTQFPIMTLSQTGFGHVYGW